MKKFFVSLLACLLCVSLFGCAARPEPTVQIPNPLHDATQDEVLGQEGVKLAIPAEAQDLNWTRIDGDPALYEVTFRYQDHDYCVRAQKSGQLEDISGLYYEWGQPEGGDPPKDGPVCYVLEDMDVGVLLWYADGWTYSVAMTEKVSGDLLVSMYGLLTA